MKGYYSNAWKCEQKNHQRLCFCLSGSLNIFVLSSLQIFFLASHFMQYMMFKSQFLRLYNLSKQH